MANVVLLYKSFGVNNKNTIKNGGVRRVPIWVYKYFLKTNTKKDRKNSYFLYRNTNHLAV